jgi:hypothetical protein
VLRETWGLLASPHKRKPVRKAPVSTTIVDDLSYKRRLFVVGTAGHFEDGQEGFLRNIDFAHTLHAFFAFFLFFKELAFA